jgi:hypothetical protein
LAKLLCGWFATTLQGNAWHIQNPFPPEKEFKKQEELITNKKHAMSAVKETRMWTVLLPSWHSFAMYQTCCLIPGLDSASGVLQVTEHALSQIVSAEMLCNIPGGNVLESLNPSSVLEQFLPTTHKAQQM